MPMTDSTAMDAFRANVLQLIKSQPHRSVAWLAREMSHARRPEEKAVSRPFLTNVLNGHYDCTVPFAEEIARALDVPLAALLSAPQKKSKQIA